MGTICYHMICYNNTVHHYTTYDKTWEQSVTTRAVITTLYITTQHTTSHGNNLLPHDLLEQRCASLHNIRQNMGTISNHRSYYNNTVHHYTTYDKTWEQSVTTGAVITTLCITTQHTTSHENNLLPHDLL